MKDLPHDDAQRVVLFTKATAAAAAQAQRIVGRQLTAEELATMSSSLAPYLEAIATYGHVRTIHSLRRHFGLDPETGEDLVVVPSPTACDEKLAHAHFGPLELVVVSVSIADLVKAIREQLAPRPTASDRKN